MKQLDLYLLRRCFIVMTDPAVYRDVFAKSTDAAGRPFVRTWVLTQKILNPRFPKLGKLAR